MRRLQPSIIVEQTVYKGMGARSNVEVACNRIFAIQSRRDPHYLEKSRRIATATMTSQASAVFT